MSEIRPYQFVGYWGYGNPTASECLLRRILKGEEARTGRYSNTKAWECTDISTKFSASSSSFSLPEKHVSQQAEDYFWGVGYLGLEENCIEAITGEGVIAGLSAAGLHPAPDAWVKVLGDCLILGREPFGRVPLYWTQLGQIIWFASRLQLLLPVVETPQFSIPGLYGYSCFSYVPTPLTSVENIFAVPAGAELVWHKEGNNQNLKSTIQNRQEWREAPVLLQDEREATTQLQTLLQSAIYRQLAYLPSEPVGVFLSGGIDSSTIAALLVQAGVKVRAYALDFEPILGNNRFNEFSYAQQVADYLKIPLVKVEVTPQKIRKAIAAAAQALDVPFGDGAPLPLFLLSQVASQETSVIFNGENGDQLFAGWTNKPLIAAGIYNTHNPAGAKDFNQQYLETFSAVYGYEALCFQPDVYAQVQTLNPQDWLQEALNPSFCSNLLARLRRATLMLKGAQNIQPRANNIGLSQGLWVRSPFCDLPLTEWAFQLSGELCLRGTCEKYILKKAVESWLPPEVVWREKQGMAIPVTTLCLSSLQNEVRKWLSPSRLQLQGIWQPQLPIQVIRGQVGGQIKRGRIGRILWLLMMWQAWVTTVLGETYPSATPTQRVSRFFYDAFYFPPFELKIKR
ncbi:MAG: asparagine synthetase B family protein [Cyanobacteriota bacterium]